jgi:tRNA(adenine34) deaminase
LISPNDNHDDLGDDLGDDQSFEFSDDESSLVFQSDLIDWDQKFMRQALTLAEQAMQQDEVPVGALVTHDNRVIGSGWNQRESLQDPTAHAEMIAITQAAASAESWRLNDCTLYVTLEPCPMCAGAILQARFARVVYGAADPKAGAVDSLFRLLNDPRLNHRCQVTSGVLAEQCGAILSHFFQLKRQQGKK